MKNPLKQFMVPKPLTRAEIHDAAIKRTSEITQEFTDGFEFIKDYSKSVTIFGSARFADDNPYYTKAHNLGKLIAERLGYTVFTGGGPGIMEAANKGAFEARGSSVGITIKLPHEQVTNMYLTDSISLYYFFARKVCLSFSAEAYVFFPGGFGTLDELMEILTLVQTNKIQKVPVILVGKEFWSKFDDFLRSNLVTLETIDEKDLDLYKITDDENEVIDIIKNAPVRNGLKYAHEENKI